MKNRLRLVLTAAALVCALAGCKAAEEIKPAPTPKAASPEVVVNHELVPNEHIITVTGYAEVIAQPDYATLTLGVQGTAETAEQASMICEENLASVYDVARELGVPYNEMKDAGVTITAQQKEDEGVITGYLATAAITIIANDTSAANSIMSGIVDASVGELKSITYSITDTTAAYNAALLAAMDAARVKAETLAEASGVTLGAVIGVVETPSNDNELVGVDFESSAIAVPARVTVDYRIDDVK